MFPVYTKFGLPASDMFRPIVEYLERKEQFWMNTKRTHYVS